MNLAEIGNALVGKIDSVMKTYNDVVDGNYGSVLQDLGDLLSFAGELAKSQFNLSASPGESCCHGDCDLASSKLAELMAKVSCDIKPKAEVAADPAATITPMEIFSILQIILQAWSAWRNRK